MVMEDFKIKNLTPEQSRVIQETVFNNGGIWVSGKIKVQHTDSKMLFLSQNHLSFTFDLNYFIKQNLPEITFEEFERKYINKLPPHISELPYVEMEVRDYDHQDWEVRKVVYLVDEGCVAITGVLDGINHWYQYRPIQQKTTITKQQIAEIFGIDLENLIIEE